MRAVIYLVSYEMGEPGADEVPLAATIREYGDYVHIHGKVWLIRTAESASQIRDKLRRFAGPFDQVYVTRLHADRAWLNLFVEVAEWLENLKEEDFV